MIPGARLITWVSGLVPIVRREAWRREWEAEVAYAWQRMNRDGKPSPSAVLRLRLRVLSCVVDALWEKEMMTMTGMFNDLRFAARSLLRYPTFTAIAVLTLALGIGANTAVFTLVDGVLLSPLPFDEANDLVALEHQGREGRDQLPMSQGLYFLYRDQVTSLDGIALHVGSTVNLVSQGEPLRVRIQAVTPGFFDVLRVEPALGRTFTEAEGHPEGESVIVLSDGFWKSQFGADPAVIGQSLDINGRLRTIVGVMPPDFGHPDRTARFWMPLQMDPLQAPLAAFGASGVGRLASGASIKSLDTEMSGLISRLAELFPDSGAPAFLAEVGLAPVVTPLKESVVGNIQQTLWILLGTVGFVLLIACANVANLLLVRAEGRQRELALRVAVGAGKMHILRSFMSESIVLAGVGSLLGIAIAWVTVRASIGLVPTDLPRVEEIGLDLRVLGFTSVLAIGSAVFFGFFPLLRYGVSDLASQLRDGSGRGATGGKGRTRLRSGLVVLQMALALVLLVGSGLMLRSLQALRSMDPGFDSERILTARITVPTAEIEGWEATAGFYRTLGERLAAQPGVEAVGFAQSVPLGGGLGYFNVEIEGHSTDPGAPPIFASNNQVEAGYLEAMGIELLEGRTFRAGDGAEGTRSVIVAQAFADHWWPGESALGRRMRLGFEGEDWYQVIGVVGDANYSSLEEAPEEMVYWPGTVGPAESPQATRTMDVAIRTSDDPLPYVAVLRREVQALNTRIPVSNPRTMEDVVSAATSRISFTMALLGAASGIALLLGLVGIYGVISYVVSQRTREIGVRLALGATAPAVRRMVVNQGLVLAAGGVAVGLLAARVLSGVMSSLLFGVSATDPLTYGAVAVALLLVSVTASWVPASRAARVDPSLALRSE
jgi:putative ABC transport system permease protein